MLRPRNIIYGFCNSSNPPKQKYLISIYRDDNVNVFAWFTTSKSRAGKELELNFHGVVKKDGVNPSAYVFCKDREIGKKQETQEPFCFPCTTTIAFDYGSQEATQDKILANFDNPEVVGILSEKEYTDLVYSMYKSNDVKQKYKPYLESILNEYCK